MAAIFQLMSAGAQDAVNEADMAVVGSLDFNGQPSNVDHGAFWTVDTVYGDCYWSAWVKPTNANETGYFISDGSGGAHNVLMGGSTSSTAMTVTGNVYDGSAICTVSSCDTIPLNDWVHVEFISNSTTMYVLINGICSFYGSLTQGGSWTATYAGTRSFGAGGSNGHLYAGGSYHNNFPGQMAKLRGVEGSNCGVTTENRFVPRDYDGYVTNADGATRTRTNFASDYSVGGTRSFVDMGAGFESRVHHGAFSRYDSNTSFPTWVAGEVTPSSVVPTAPSTPAGALVFDSFSRTNNLALFDNVASLGTTEAGSLGVKTWRTPTGNNTDGRAGVLYGRAVLYTSQASYVYVPTDRTDVDIRVTRPTQVWASTGICARFKDTDNYYLIHATDTAISFTFREAGVTSYPAGFNVSTGWSVLRVVMNGTTMEVFVDGVSAGTKTVINDGAATNHGLAGAGNVARYDDFTILAVA